MKMVMSLRPLFNAPLGRPPIWQVSAQGLRLANWLGINQVLHRPWLKRMPAILSASIILTGFLFLSDFSLDEIRAGLALVLFSAAGIIQVLASFR